MRRADDGADGREAAVADEVRAPLRDERGDLLPDRPAVREREILDLAAGVRGLDDAEDPGAVAPGGGEVRLDRLAPEPGIDGERVGERLVAFEVRGRVGARGRADVAALAVGDHEQPGAARVEADVGERLHPVLAERLEERELRLDGDRVRRDRVDDPAAEAGDVAAQLDGHQVVDGSRPTTSWLRLRSTSAATRSPKVSVATAIATSLDAAAALP